MLPTLLWRGVTVVASRYYLVQVKGQIKRWMDIQTGMKASAANRRADLPWDRMTIRVSDDGNWLLVKANTTDEEHASVLGVRWITYLGERDEQTGSAPDEALSYLASNQGNWTSGAILGEYEENAEVVMAADAGAGGDV